MICPHRTGIPFGIEGVCEVDASRLRHAIRSDGRSLKRLECDAGLSKGAVSHVLRRGRCTILTLEALCSALAIHESEVEV